MKVERETTSRRFDRQTLELLERTLEVVLETVRADDSRRRTTIWVVVDDGEVFVRSVRGDRGNWFQAALDRPDELALCIGERRIPARAVLLDDDASVARCSAALERKYAGDPDTPSMLRQEVLATTMRLEPVTAG